MLLLLLLLLLENLLDDLLLLNEESTHNPVTDASCAAGATIGTGNRLLVLGQALVHDRPEVRDPLEDSSTVATLNTGGLLADVVEGEHATRRFDLADLVGLGRVRVTTTVCEALDHAD